MASLYTEPIKCNVLMIGKPGAGKSAFADYLFSTEVFSAGGGMPVGDWEQNLQVYSMEIKGTSANVYHSVGFGSDVSRQWMEDLDHFLEERQVVREEDIIPKNNHIHTLYYLVNGAGGSIESAEMEMLSALCDKHKLTVSVVITRCDIAAEAQIKAIEGEAERQGLPSMRVCAVPEGSRDGKKVARYGRKRAMRQILAASFAQVGCGLSALTIEVTCAMLKAILPELKATVRRTKMSYVRIATVNDSLDEVRQGIHNKYIRIYRRDVLAGYRDYYQFLTDYRIAFEGRNELEETMNEIRDVLALFSSDGMTLMGIVERATPNRRIRSNSDGFVQMIIFMGKFFRIKQYIAQCYDIIFAHHLRRLDNQLDYLERFGVDDEFIMAKGAYEDGALYEGDPFEDTTLDV